MRHPPRKAGTARHAGQHMALGLQRQIRRQLADQRRFADLVLALGQNAAGLAGGVQGQRVKMLFEQGAGTAEDGGLLTRWHQGPGLLRRRSGRGGRGHVCGIGNAHTAQYLAGRRLHHIAQARAQRRLLQAHKVEKLRRIRHAHGHVL
jgi:hypothetical protein